MTTSEADRAYLVEMRTRVELGGATGESSSRPIMDSCRSGLEFFRPFGPAYAAYTRTTFNFQHDIVARYDKEGDIAYDKLRADADRFGDTHDRLTDNIVNLRNTGSPIFEAWHGDAASSAQSLFDGMLSGTDGVRGQFARLRDILRVAVDAVDRVMFEKAAGVLELHSSTVGGVSAEDVSFLVDFGRRCATGGVADEELSHAAGLCDLELNPVVCRTNPDIFGKVAADVDGWLRTVFVPFYQARLATFDALYTATEQVVTAAWAGLEAALRAVHTDHFDNTVTPTASAAPKTPVAPANRTAPAPAPPAQPDPQEPLESGQHAAVDTMLPSAAAAPLAAPIAPLVASATGGGGTTFFGAPFYGGVAAAGGGDRDHKRGVPIAADLFGDAPRSPDTETALIGGATDPAVHNQDTQPEPEPKSLIERLLDDEEDLW